MTRTQADRCRAWSRPIKKRRYAEVAANGKALGTVPGKDFGDALMRVWLGPKPSDKALKDGLLGL